MGKLRAVLVACVLIGTAVPASAEPILFTYSYSNLLDGQLQTTLSTTMLRAATEEALGVWVRYAPITFVEMPDAGPPPSDEPYPAAGTPDVRIGHHDAEHSHAFFPWAPGGLARDIHLRTSYADPFYWALGDDPDPAAVDILATLVHEVGHVLGLSHFEGAPAIMNELLDGWYSGLGTAFLFEPDIEALQALYGAGTGAVHPLEAAPVPEPGTLLLLALPLAALLLFHSFSSFRHDSSRRGA